MFLKVSLYLLPILHSQLLCSFSKEFISLLKYNRPSLPLQFCLCSRLFSLSSSSLSFLLPSILSSHVSVPYVRLSETDLLVVQQRMLYILTENEREDNLCRQIQICLKRRKNTDGGVGMSEDILLLNAFVLVMKELKPTNQQQQQQQLTLSNPYLDMSKSTLRFRTQARKKNDTKNSEFNIMLYNLYDCLVQI